MRSVAKEVVKDGDAMQQLRDRGVEAYATLKASIRCGELKAGDRLVEKDVTERLGMSRTPVREALQRLESEGLLTYEPRRGLTVTRPDHQMIMELYSMREALERKAASLAAQHASDIEIATLADLIADEANFFDDEMRSSEINQRIHRMMHLAAHNRYLLRSLGTMNDTMALLPTMLGNPNRARDAHGEHLKILDGIQRRDPIAAGKAAEEHIRNAQRVRLQWLVESGSLNQPLLDGVGTGPSSGN